MSVVDPRPPALRIYQPTSTFVLEIGFRQDAITGETLVTADGRGTLYSSCGYNLMFEAGPSQGQGACDVGPESFVGEVVGVLQCPSMQFLTEGLTAEVRAGHLIGTITIEGYTTTFDAVPR